METRPERQETPDQVEQREVVEVEFQVERELVVSMTADLNESKAWASGLGSGVGDSAWRREKWRKNVKRVKLRRW